MGRPAGEPGLPVSCTHGGAAEPGQGAPSVPTPLSPWISCTQRAFRSSPCPTQSLPGWAGLSSHTHSHPHRRCNWTVPPYCVWGVLGMAWSDPPLFILGVREHNSCFLKGSLRFPLSRLPFPFLPAWPKPPGVAAMNLKDLKRLRLLCELHLKGPRLLWTPLLTSKTGDFCL